MCFSITKIRHITNTTPHQQCLLSHWWQRVHWVYNVSKAIKELGEGTQNKYKIHADFGIDNRHHMACLSSLVSYR